MSQTSAGPAVVRVSVASATRRVDLVLPGAVPVAELVPELARSVGLLDAATAHGGYVVWTQDGRRLAVDVGLSAQGVVDGGLLTVAAGSDAEPPRVYDDVVEAMADAVGRELRAWEPAAGRRTALLAAALLLAAGAAALLLQPSGPEGGATALVVAALLVGGAVVHSRVRDDTAAAVAVAGMGAGYAGVAGLLLASRTDRLVDAATAGPPVAAAGVGLVGAGLVGLVGIGRGRVLLLPVPAVGAVLIASGLVVDLLPVPPGVVLTTALVVAVVAGSVFPWLALAATSTRVEPAGTGVDPARVAADARVAHEVLVAVTVTVGVLLVVASPVAVALGPTGTALAVACCAAVLLRSRQHHSGAVVLAGVVSGVAGLVAVAVAVLVLHPAWRADAAYVLTAAGVLALAGAGAGAASLRRARLGDVVESVVLLALLPLLAVATGLVDAVTG